MRGHRDHHRRSRRGTDVTRPAGRRTTWRHSACGKRRYPDHNAAVIALQRAQATGATEAEFLGTTNRAERRIYECERCRGFHLTSVPVAPRFGIDYTAALLNLADTFPTPTPKDAAA